ncbi:alpha/beta-Hydrolases superfamily protein, partial [Striga asiatica]
MADLEGGGSRCVQASWYSHRVLDTAPHRDASSGQATAVDGDRQWWLDIGRRRRHGGWTWEEDNIGSVIGEEREMGWVRQHTTAKFAFMNPSPIIIALKCSCGREWGIVLPFIHFMEREMESE